MEKLNQVYEIKISEIKQIKNFRSTTDSDSMTELMGSIKHQGLLQPIGVRKIDKKSYEVMYGNRRFMACKKLGHKTILAMVHENIDESKERDVDFICKNLSENFQRLDINTTDFGEQCIRLMEEFELTERELSVRLSLPLRRIKDAINVCKIVPEEMKKHIVTKPFGSKSKQFQGKIGSSIAAKIENIATKYNLNKNQIEKLFKTAKDFDLTEKQMALIKSFMRDGQTLEESIDFIKKWISPRVSVILHKDDYDKLVERFGGIEPAIHHILMNNSIVKLKDYKRMK